MKEFNIIVNGKWNDEGELALATKIEGTASIEMLQRAYVGLGHQIYLETIKQKYNIEESEAEQKYHEIVKTEEETNEHK